MAKKKWLPRWFYQLASPRWCYQICGRLLPIFAVLAAVLIVVALVWGLAFAPSDYKQHDSFRIIYLHVPSAILSESCYMLMAVAAAIGLIWKIKVADLVVRCCAPFGASMAALALLTGAIWGKPTWGAWWVWDARLTSMLILFFLYLGVIALNSAFEGETTAARASGVLAIVGAVNIPIIKYSVVWWNTLHQTATFTLTEKPKMPAEMWVPLLVSVLGFYCFFAVILMLRLRNEIIYRERRAGWVREELSK